MILVDFLYSVRLLSIGTSSRSHGVPVGWCVIEKQAQRDKVVYPQHI